MKKILFVIGSLACGGAEKVLINIVNNLDRKKYKIELLAVYDGGAFRNMLKEDIKYKSIIKTKNRILRSVLIRIFSKVLSAKVLHKMFVRNKYDIEVAFLEGISTKIVGGSKNKCKKIAWVHINMKITPTCDFYYRSIKEEKKIYDKFDNIIIVSEKAKEAFESKFNIKDKCKFLVNPIDSKVIKIQANDINLMNKNKSFEFIAVGRLDKRKGFDRLIRIIKKLNVNGLKCSLQIIGDGIERENLDKLIDELNLKNKVRLLGYRENPYKYMKNSEALVLSSFDEGYPTCIIEALIVGIPVIATNCTGVSEILGNGEYGMISKNNEDDLYLKMRDFYLDRDKQIYYKNKAKERASFYDISKSIQEIERMLE